MTSFVALLRGVNVGRAKRVPMAELRSLLTGLGYTNVKTILNSGNAVFDSTGRSTTAHAARIHAAIVDKLGVDVPVIVKSAKGIAAIKSGNKLASGVSDPSRLLVAFTGDAKVLEGLAVLSSLVEPPDQILFGEHAMYLWCANGILESRAASAMLGKFGRGATTRNWATFMKISALLAHDAE